MTDYGDINGTPVRMGDRVECLDIENGGAMGTAKESPQPGWVCVEWDNLAGEQFEHPTERLRVHPTDAGPYSHLTPYVNVS